MRSTDKVLMTSAITLALVLSSAPALAEVANSGTQNQAQQDVGGDDIIVTARRQNETLMSVPVVVSAITSEEIKRYNAADLSSIGQMTPTVIVADFGANGGGSIAIRGISSPANQSGFEQAVSVAIDGVQTSNGHITKMGFFDLAQTEILKGPQALFFGKNNTAGVISLTTADPTPDWSFSARTGYEFIGDEATLEGAVSGPISDKIGVRVAAKYSYLDGWMRNNARPIANPFYKAETGAPISAATLPGTYDPRPGSKKLLARATIVIEPDPTFKIKIKAFGAQSDDAGPAVSLQNIGPCSGGFPRAYGTADPFGECKADRNVSVGDVPPVVTASMPPFAKSGINKGHLDAYSGSINLSKDLGGDFNITSLSGYSNVSYEWFGGLDHNVFAQLAMYEITREKQFSQEIRLSGRISPALDFMLGAYYGKSKISMDNDVSFNTGNYQSATGRFDSFAHAPRQNGETVSAFGQARWNVTEQFELAGGLRWTHESKDLRKSNTYGVGIYDTSATVYATSVDKTPGILAGRFRDSNISPEVTFTWRPEQNKTVFIAYKTGFKSGGFGLTNPMSKTTVLNSVDFNSEKAEGFEAGAKGLFLDNQLRLSLAVFKYKFTDLQVNTFDPATISYNINNAGRVEQKGAEVEAKFRVNDILTVHGAVAWTDNKFRNFVGQCYAYTFPTGSVRATATPPPNCSFASTTGLALQQDFDGRTPARSPKWSGNIGGVATIPVGENSFEITADGQYTGRYYAADTLVAGSLQRSFWLLNSSASYLTSDERWKLSLIGKNLTNKYYVSYAVDRVGGSSVAGAIGEQRGVVSRGREITLQASFKY